MVILAVDYGDARTGLAVCDRGEVLASPAGVIAEWSAERCAEKIALHEVPSTVNGTGTPNIIGAQYINCHKSTKKGDVQKCERFDAGVSQVH